MCTGSGKTIVAIEAMRRTLAATATDIAVVVCPTKVLADQWITELRRWNPTSQPVAAYQAVTDYFAHVQLLLTSPSRHTPGRAIVTTYATFSSPHFQNQLRAAANRKRRALLVADEAHHISSAAALEQLSSLDSFFIYRLALTATPELEANPESTDRLLVLFGGVVFRYRAPAGHCR